MFKSLSLLLAVVVVAEVHGLSPMEKQRSYAAAREGMLRIREGNAKLQEGRRRLLQTRTYPSNAAPPGTTTSAGLLLYTPVNSSYLDGDDFANFFQDNYNINSTKGIALTPGNYTVNIQTTYKPWVLSFICSGNPYRPTVFQMNLYGSVLYNGNGNLGHVGWDACANINFAGPSITYAQDQQVFSQGTVTDLGINDGSGNWTIQIDYGYPSDPTIPMFQNQHLAVFYDGNGHVKQNQSDFNIGPFTSVGAGTFTFPGPVGVPGIYPGIRFVFRGDTYATHAWVSTGGKNFRVVDTSIWSSNIFGIFDASSYNSTYQNVQIVPDPTPRNRPPPLFSSNADGIHCVFPSYGPTVINSSILNTGDDSLAVHANYYVIGQINTTGPKSQWNITFGSWDCNNLGCLSLQPGGPIQLYTSDFRDLGFAIIKNITQVPQPQNVSGTSVVFGSFDYDTANYFSATLNSWPSNWTQAAWGGLVTSPRLSGNYANISGNTVANWNYNITVTQNYINVTNAGIVMSALNDTLQAPIYQNHKNNKITFNTIQGPVHPLVIGSASGLTVSNNLFIDGCCYPYVNNDDLWNQGGGQGVLVFASYTTTSTFSANNFTTNNAACTQYGNYMSPYVKGPGATSIKIS